MQRYCSRSNQISRGIAETIVLGKSFAETLKQIAQNVLVNIIAQQIEYIALLGIQNILGIQDAKLQEKKTILIRKQNTNLKKTDCFTIVFKCSYGGGSARGV